MSNNNQPSQEELANINLETLSRSIASRKGFLKKLKAKLEQEKEGTAEYIELQNKIKEKQKQFDLRVKLKEDIEKRESLIEEPTKISALQISPVEEEEEEEKLKIKEQTLHYLAQPKTLSALPSIGRLMADARAYDSNKDKEFYDESMRTSNASQTAIFNEPASATFNPPEGYGPLIGPVQIDPELPPKEFFSKLKAVPPLIGGLATGILPALAFKMACTTALTTFIPWVPIAVGLVSATYNLKQDYNRNKELDPNFSAKNLLNKKSLSNAFKSGIIGAGASFAGILGVDALIDTFASEAACSATETVNTEPAPLVEAPVPEPEVIPDPVVPITADQIIDTTMLLDGVQNDLAFAENLIENATAHGADPAAIAELQAKVDAGFDFIDTATSADAVALFNAGLENALDASSDGGTSVTPDEYAQILTSFIEKLNSGQFIVDVPGDQDIATNLDVASLTSQGQALRAAIA